MREVRRAAAVGALAAVLLLGACSGDSDEATPGTASPSPTSTPEPAPEPAGESPASTSEPTLAPTVDPHPALADLVISTSGLGPLTVGSLAPAENPGAAMIERDEDFCAEIAEEGAEAARWVASGYEDDTGYASDPVTPFFVDASDAGVRRIDVMGAAPRTPTGLGIGSAVSELQAAHPELAGPFEGPVSRVWWIQDEAGTIAFETQGEAGGLRPAGTAESVILIRVLAPGVPPDFAAANTDDVAGGCL